MAHLEFKAFLSCSFAQEDREIVDLFQAFCDSFGFEVVKYDFQEPRRLTEAIKEYIVNSDCVIAVLTRRNRLESGEWICPEWVQHEVVFANAIGKPLAIFVEDGVRIHGFIRDDVRFQAFSRDRNEFLKIAPQITKYFMGLHHQLEDQLKSGAEPAPVMFHNSIISRDELTSRDTWATTCEVEVEALVDNLGSCHEPIGDIDWLLSPKEVIRNFEFSVIQAPSGVSARCEFVRTREEPNELLVSFEPALSLGQRLRFAYRYEANRIRPYTTEEAQGFISQGNFWCDDPICAVNWSLLNPTGKLVCEVVFPPKYPVHKPDFTVETRDSNLVASRELERIKQLEGFKVHRIFDKYSLILSVSKPLKGYTYIITWQPPHEKELVQAG